MADSQNHHTPRQRLLGPTLGRRHRWLVPLALGVALCAVSSPSVTQPFTGIDIGPARGPYLPEIEIIEFEGSFRAGTVGNAVVFRVENTTAFPVEGLNLRPQLPAQYLTLDSIEPMDIDLDPGEVIEIFAFFSVRADAEAGARDTIGFHFDTRSASPLPFPNYRLIAMIEEGEPEAGQAQCNSAVEAGGDEGGGVTVDLGGFVGLAGFTWEMYNIKDRMDVTVGGVQKTTGCVSGSDTFEIDILPGAQSAQVQVFPNCEGTTGTQWTFTFECPLKSAVTADGTGTEATGGGARPETAMAGAGTTSWGAPVAPAPPLPVRIGPTGLQTAEAEPNNDLASAVALTPGDAATGRIPLLGDADFYRIAIPSQGELTIDFTASPSELDMAFRVLDGQGREVRGWQAAPTIGQAYSTRVDIRSGGDHVIEVRDSFNNARSDAAYTLSTSFLPTADPAEPNDTGDTATPLGWNRTVAANILPLGDADFYAFNTARQGRLTVSFPVTPSPLDMSFRILDAQGREIRGWQASPRLGEPFTAHVDLAAPGSYRIEVRDSFNNARSESPYQVAIAFDPTSDPAEPNDDRASATPVPLDTRVDANILPLGDADFYRVGLAHQGQLTVSFPEVPPELDMSFRVLNFAGAEMHGWQHPPITGQPFTGQVDLRHPGDFVIEVRDSFNNARSERPYGMILSFIATLDRAEPNDDGEQATRITLGETVQASILPLGDADFYRLRVPAQGELVIDFPIAPPGIDMAFRVLAADGRELRGWQAAPERGNAFTGTVDLRDPGDYLLEVRDSFNNARSVAPYTLVLGLTPTEDPSEPNDTPATATSLVAGVPVRASILPRGDVDHYRIDVAATANLKVEFTDSPPDLDMSFRVLASDGREIAGWRTAPQPGALFSATVEVRSAGGYLIEVRDGFNDVRSGASYGLVVTLDGSSR